MDAEKYDLNPEDEEEGQDIFDIYGFGITSWFSLLLLLIKIYFVFACLGAGLMYYYSTHGTELTGPAYYKSSKYTLGNLGYSRSKCDMMYFDIEGEHTINCLKGEFEPLIFMGIVPKDLDDELPQDYCGDPTLIPEINKCSKNVKKSLEDSFNKECAGKKKC
jgi:hypothetical protein